MPFLSPSEVDVEAGVGEGRAGKGDVIYNNNTIEVLEGQFN